MAQKYLPFEEAVERYNKGQQWYDTTRELPVSAPVKKKKKKDKFFDSGAFSDGYQFGDVTKTILGTGADIVTSAGKGVWDVGQGTAKLIVGGIAESADLFGKDEYAAKLRNRLAGKDEKVNKRLENIDIFGRANKVADKGSVLGEKTDRVFESVGQIGAYTVPVLGQASMFTSSAGSNLSEAYSKGATDAQAWTKALVGGGISVATEKLFGLFGESGLDTAVANKISSKLTSGIAKTLARQGVQATAEGVEEVIEYTGDQLLDWAIDKVSNGKGAKLKEDWNWEEVGESFANAFISSTLVGAGQTAVGVNQAGGINEYASQVDSASGMLTENEQKVLDNVIEQRIEEATQNQDLSKKEIKAIETQAKEDLQNGNISVETIENTLGLKNYINDVITDVESKMGRQITQEELNNVEQLTRNRFLENIQGDRLLQNSYVSQENNVNNNETNNGSEVLDVNNIEDLNYSDELKSEIDYKTKQANKNKNVNYVSTDKIINYLKTGGERNVGTTDSIIQSIKDNGITNPITVSLDKNGDPVIVDGNHRIYAAKRMGLSEVPITFEEMNKQQIKDFLIENNIDKDYNINKLGDDYVYNDSKNKSINEENSNIRQSEESGIKNNTNEARTKESLPVSSRESEMDQRSFDDTGNNENKGIYNANERSEKTRSNQQNIESKIADKVEKKVTKQVNDAIAPLKDSIDEINKSIDKVMDNIAPIAEKVTNLEQVKEQITEDKLTKAKTLANRQGIKSAAQYFKKAVGLDTQEFREFKDSLNQFTNMTRSDLVDNKDKIRDIINQYSVRQVESIDDSLKEVKDYLKGIKIKVDESIKNDIADYNDFRKSYFGKLNLSNDGISVDRLYDEMIEMFPGIVDPNVITPSDRLQAIADIVDTPIINTDDVYLSDDELRILSDNVFNKLNQNALTDIDVEELNKEIQNKLAKKTKISRKDVRNFYKEQMGITTDDLLSGKDISTINYQRTIPIRVVEKVFSPEVAQKINNELFIKERHNEAERVRFINEMKDQVKELGFKDHSKESAAVQKYAEKQYVNDAGELVEYGDKELAKEFSNVETQNKIKQGAKLFRQLYDKTLEQVNEVLERNGYDKIEQRKDYMPHFQEMTDLFSKWGLPFNRESMNSELLPTDINGLTEMFSPGKSWFANAQQRKGIKTVYDAVTGFDKYIDGISNLIYHTDDIQRYRTLEEQVRTTFGQSEGYDNILSDPNATDDQIDAALEGIKTNQLSGFARWLHEQGNALANKKSAIDRAPENLVGRKIYQGLSTLKKQVGSNMTGLNVRSAMTNFISSTIASAKTSKIAMIKGTYDTIKNMFHDDGFIDKSDFLTSRLKSDNQLSKKLWQKASNAGQIFMNGSDWFTANMITRSKYYEGLSQGLSENQAIQYADDFAARVLGDRSKGQTAELFNSKTLGFLTQFQLETTNQWDYMIHDTKQEIKDKSALRAGATVVFEMGQLAAYSYFFNELFEKLTGSRAAFDPIEIFKKLFGKDEDDEGNNLEEAANLLLDALPFGNLISGGGRLPVAEALPIKELISGEDKYGNDKSRLKTLSETLPYYFLPTGFSQVKKTTQGLSMYDEDLPVKGSYTNSGNLRFTAEDTPEAMLKSALFGRWSSKEAQDYIDSGFKTISSSNIEEMKNLGMNSTEYRKYRKELNESGKKVEDKLNYIKGLDIPYSEKNIMAKGVLNKDIDMDVYDNYDSYHEFNYANKYPGKYAVSKAVSDNFNNYLEYTDNIYNIKADKDDNGKSITGSRKKKVYDYINSLDNLDYGQKCILAKLEYKSDNRYNNQIIQYLNNSNLDYDTEASILRELGFKVSDDGRITW